MQKIGTEDLATAILDAETILVSENLIENVLSSIMQAKSCAISWVEQTKFEELSNLDFLCEKDFCIICGRKSMMRYDVEKIIQIHYPENSLFNSVNQQI